MILDSEGQSLNFKYPDIEFKYSPPYCPGGLWESTIKLTKKSLYKVLSPGIVKLAKKVIFLASSGVIGGKS